MGTVVAAAAASVAGCYASAGPSIGITFEGRPTMGWEAGGASVNVGQSYELAGTDRATRTYLVWEPGFVRTLTDTSAGAAFDALGTGFTVGGSWKSRRQTTEGRWIAGFWWAGSHMLPGEGSNCGDDFDERAYGALVVGLRGDEFYLAPKAGFVAIPNLHLFCSLKF